MSTQYSNHRDTPVRRFSTFCWGLAAFGSFGLISAIAYVSTSGNTNDVESVRAAGRTVINAEVAEAQSALLTEKEIEAGKTKQVPPSAVFSTLGNEIKAAPKKTENFVPGSEAYNKQVAAMSEKGGAGFELFKAKTCATCHGMDGNRPISPLYPRLGGQPVEYLLGQMKDFRDGKRTNGQAAVMKALMATITDEEMQILAKWMSEQKLEMTAAEDHAGHTAFLSKGCIACHGVDAKTPLMPLYPNLLGQNKDYLANQLKDIKSGARNNGMTAVMKGIMAAVSDDEIKAISEWLSTPAE